MSTIERWSFREVLPFVVGVGRHGVGVALCGWAWPSAQRQRVCLFSVLAGAGAAVFCHFMLPCRILPPHCDSTAECIQSYRENRALSIALSIDIIKSRQDTASTAAAYWRRRARGAAILDRSTDLFGWCSELSARWIHHYSLNTKLIFTRGFSVLCILSVLLLRNESMTVFPALSKPMRRLLFIMSRSVSETLLLWLLLFICR